MDTIILPKLERTVFQQTGKNINKQLIAPPFELRVNIVENKRSFVVIEFEGIKYCLTCNEAVYPNDVEYILLTNQKFTIESMQNKGVYVKKWIKHPLWKEYSVRDVLSSWENDFHYTEENQQEKVQGLRSPQIGALHAILGHLQLSLDTATVVLPTGTGKTETMLSTLVANRCNKVLVAVPSDSLRRQVFEKFVTLGLLKQFGIVGEKSLYPIVGIIRENFKSTEELKNFFEQCNVIVTTMHILIDRPDEEQKLIASLCSNLFIDEAHHVKAPSWNRLKKKFPKEKVIQFTATPFRNDRQRLDGKIIFNFPLRMAQEQGYFTKIDFLPVREYDSEIADTKIAQIAIQRLRDDLANKRNHILMARCATKERARKIYELYRPQTDLNPVMI
jgi:superfamily II DNA or RNA helicase